MFALAPLTSGLLLPRAAPLHPRAPPPSLSLADAQEELCKALRYNKPFTEDSRALLQSLADSGSAPAAGEQWWTGKLILRSCSELAKALRAAGGPLLDGSPVTVSVSGDGEVELETDMLVLGCATGLRILGTAEADGEQLRVSASETEFFEPSEEFGGRSGSQKKLRAGHGKHTEAAQPGRPPLSPSLSPHCLHSRRQASARRSPSARRCCGRSCPARSSRSRCASHPHPCEKESGPQSGLHILASAEPRSGNALLPPWATPRVPARAG